MGRDECELVCSYYYVALVGVWETFFRDLFVFLHTTDVELFERLLERVDGKHRGQSVSIEEFDFDLCELVSKSFNFQNLDDINEAFGEFFPDGIIESACLSAIGPVYVDFEYCDAICIDHTFPNWRELLGFVFRERHHIIHNSNYRFKLPPEPGKNEAIMFLVPQIVGLIVANRFSLGITQISREGDASAALVWTPSMVRKRIWSRSDEIDG